jgi:predicted dithiol-disulfide oxidoreductase (DUF899 family)
MGERRQGRAAREVLRAVRRQEFAAALFIHVRPELGQAVSVLHLADGWVDRSWYQVSQDAAFAAIAKAPAEKIDVWAKERGWSQIPLLSGYESTFQKDYGCQGETDDDQQAAMHAFRKRDGKIFHFWSAEAGVDTVWPYWNLMDFTPEGRPDRLTPPQNFRPEFFEKHILKK